MPTLFIHAISTLPSRYLVSRHYDDLYDKELRSYMTLDIAITSYNRRANEIDSIVDSFIIIT